jgi:hypothetical protein
MAAAASASTSTYINPHSDYITKRIEALQKSPKWTSQVLASSHEEFIRDYSSNIFTNLIQATFTKTYVKRHPCTDCGGESKERCHGDMEERPILLKRALEKVWPDPTVPIPLKTILVQFLEEHKCTKFNFKCTDCHKKETIAQRIRSGKKPSTE